MTDKSLSQATSWYGRFIMALYAVLLIASGYVYWVEATGTYVLRNLLPLAVVAALAWFVLIIKVRRSGPGDMRWILGLIGFSIPAVGLSVYLHWRGQLDIDQIRSSAIRPDLLFRYLPAYSFIAGLIGFWIGWIVGKNLNEGR